LTDDNAPTVAKICIKLDGLPLAIELAAAQIKLFSPQALLSRLDDSLSVLKSNLRDGPERHASLLSAIEWSYNLLSESEQILLARLSVFLGGLSIEAVEAICWHEFEMDVLDGLGSLLNKGLLQLAENRVGEPRFFFLETIHDFARDRLRESNEADKIQHLHAEHFARWVEYAEPYTASGSEQLRWMQRLETEHDNLRAALRWSLGSDNHELGQRIVGALTKFWDWRGYHREWEAWLKRAWVDIEEAPKPVRASLVYSAGFYALNRQSAQEAIQYFLEAEQIYRELDNKSKYARTLMDRSVLLSIQPEGYQEAKRLAETACALLREIDERPLLGHALNLMGIMEHLQGNLDDAHQILEEALVLTRETGDHLCECLVLGNLGEVLCDERDYTKAEQLQTAGLKLAQEIDYKYQIAYPLKVFADIATGRGQIERAAQLLGATTAAFEEIGTRILPLDQLLYDQLADNLRERLGTKKFEAMWSKGRTMTLEESVALVLPK
jgi:non-specific serine/threonine protein kinase